MKRLLLSAPLLALLATPPSAQQDHNMNMNGGIGMSMNMANNATTALMPTEPGQGAFAAIAEIVAMLRADPDTDWTRVDIDALRRHLVDMDRLVSNTTVTSKPVAGGLEMTIDTTGPGGASVLRMVPAHGPVMTAETGWDSARRQSDGALIWTVTSPTDAAIIRALGFYGLMTTGPHHQPHHMAMARGFGMR